MPVLYSCRSHLVAWVKRCWKEINARAIIWGNTVLIYCNTAVRGLTDSYICTSPKGAQCPKECADISVKPRVCPCYNIYVTLSVLMYSIAHNSIASKVLDGKILPHQSQVSGAEEKMQWLKMQVTILNNRKLHWSFLKTNYIWVKRRKLVKNFLNNKSEYVWIL